MQIEYNLLAQVPIKVYNITMKVFRSNNEKDTFELGKKVGEMLLGGEIITLQGDLGAGKTVFTKGLAQVLGIEDEIKSPTFTYMIIYEGEKLSLFHYDAYRLQSGDEAEERGLTEYFGDKSGVCVVEWPQNIESCFEWHRVIKININYIDENTREITIDD